MSTSVLVDHGARGAREVTLDELGDIPAPEATETWFPVAHCNVLHRVEETLDAAGFRIGNRRLLVSHDGDRFFGTLDLTTQLAEGVSLSVGVRNSSDKSFPIGFCAGTRVFVCSNRAFRSEVIIARRHTRFGCERYQESLSLAVQGLHEFQAQERERVLRLQQWELSATDADALLLRSFEAGVVSSRQLPAVIKEWRAPTYEAFQSRTGWSLFNAFTHVLKDRATSNPQAFASLTMKLGRLLQPEVSHGQIAIAT